MLQIRNLRPYILILNTLLGISAISQVNSEPLKIPYDKEAGLVQITKIFEFDSISMFLLHTKSLEWIAENYKSANDVIQHNNPQDGSVIAKGVFYLNRNDNIIEVFHTVTINTKENKCRIRFSNFYYNEYFNGNYSSKSAVNVKFEDLLSFINSSKKTNSTSYLNAIQTLDLSLKRVDKLIESYGLYIEKKVYRDNDW